jgi:four helix bundle protein
VGRDRTAPDPFGPFEDQDFASSPRQKDSGDESVDAATNNDDVERSSHAARPPFAVRLDSVSFDVRRGARGSNGMTVDICCDMVVDRFEDLDAWQVADELRIEVYALTATGAASVDFKFCNQIRDAASSATRNISEGFGRFYPGEFARFMDFSIASVMEIQDWLPGRHPTKAFHNRPDPKGTSAHLTVPTGLERPEAVSAVLSLPSRSTGTEGEQPTNVERS